MINELIKKKCYIKFHDPLVNSKDIKTHIKNKIVHSFKIGDL